MPGEFTKSALSKEVALALLSAQSGAQVYSVLESQPAFLDDSNWLTYGGGKSNWDRVNNQQSIAVGALTELLINSVDALLLRKAREKGVDPRGAAAPRNMLDAVKQFYPEIPDGNLNQLSQGERVSLAERSVLIGIQRERKNSIYPNYTIVDFGEGQNPGRFQKTFLSLGEDNKDGIPFVQGRYNMGSTGTISFCTRGDPEKGMYKLIVSKRNAQDSDDLWGWSLIRVRSVRQGESNPVAEYFCPNREIPSFPAHELHAFGRSDLGVLQKGGSVVKLYEYAIGKGARGRDTGLTNALTTSIMECVLPIRVYDFDVKPRDTGLRSQGISARTFTGMKGVLSSGSGGDDDEGPSTGLIEVEASQTVADPGLGKIFIKFMGIQIPKRDYFKDLRDRVFFTINGQTQAKRGTMFLMRAGLDDIRQRLMVQVDCSEMNPGLRAVMFRADRERMAELEKTSQLEDLVVEFLKTSPAVREYANQVRSQRAQDGTTDEVSRDLIAGLLAKCDDLRELFNVGRRIEGTNQRPRGLIPFQGKQFPSFLQPPHLEDGVKPVPIDGFGVIECKTDACNDYLERLHDPGERVQPSPSELPHQFASPHNGKVRIVVHPPESSSIGDIIPVSFGFKDSSRPEPLQFDVKVKIADAEGARRRGGRGRRTDTRQVTEPAVDAPEFKWATKESDSDFTEDSGAKVSIADGRCIVWVNRSNRQLQHLLFKEGNEEKRASIENRFRIGVGILTLAMYKKLVHGKVNESETWFEALNEASSAVATHVVSLISEL